MVIELPEGKQEELNGLKKRAQEEAEEIFAKIKEIEDAATELRAILRCGFICKKEDKEQKIERLLNKLISEIDDFKKVQIAQNLASKIKNSDFRNQTEDLMSAIDEIEKLALEKYRDSA